MNWGYKLMIVIIGFVGLMGFMVYRAVHTDFQLVEKAYYKSELQYQKIIDGNKRAGTLSSRVQIIKSGDQLIVQLPGEMKNGKVEGSLWFYCPYDEKMDRHFLLEPGADARQSFKLSDFNAGNYTVKIEWTSNDEHYYSEEQITI
ncbi:MAG: FixH family protein [Chitinophagaceae bacterium]|nr:FixH family protein [Chitinophagaceae bacterium]